MDNKNSLEQRLRRIIVLAAFLLAIAVIVIITLQGMDEGVPMAPGQYPTGNYPTVSTTLV